jgi:hypothetical protein
MYRAFVHFDLVVLFVLIKRAGETTLFLFAGSSAWSGKKSVDHFLAASCARRAWRQSFQACCGVRRQRAKQQYFARR